MWNWRIEVNWQEALWIIQITNWRFPWIITKQNTFFMIISRVQEKMSNIELKLVIFRSCVFHLYSLSFYKALVIEFLGSVMDEDLAKMRILWLYSTNSIFVPSPPMQFRKSFSCKQAVKLLYDTHHTTIYHRIIFPN